MKSIMLGLILLASTAQACLICYGHVEYQMEMNDGRVFSARNAYKRESGCVSLGLVDMPVKYYDKKGKPIHYKASDVRTVWRLWVTEGGVGNGDTRRRAYTCG
jgi:hypothetical protein